MRGVAVGAALIGALLASSGNMGEGTHYASAVEAFRTGEKALEAKSLKTAVPAFEYAADRGVLGAQLRLARLYRNGGSGVERDDAKALAYYRMMAEQYADIDPLHPAARYIAEAFRAIAGYYRTGIASAGLKPNPARALRLLSQAASYFGDPAAQYELAKMYLSGEGVVKNYRMGLNWLMSAAKKKYAPAQASLGELFWKGEGVRKLRSRGLALLAIAADNASKADRAWIGKLYDAAMKSARDEELVSAQKLLTGWADFRSRADNRPITLVRHLEAARAEKRAAKRDLAGDKPAMPLVTVSDVTTGIDMGKLPMTAISAEMVAAAPVASAVSENVQPAPYTDVEIRLYHGEPTGLSLQDVDEAIAVGAQK